MSTLDFLTLTEPSEQIRQRCISPVEVTRLCLDRINEYDGILSSYVTVTGDRALKQASAVLGSRRPAGFCFGALGTDTGGSIRMPSSFCGLTGIKPTWGRVSRFGVFALAGSLDCVGPMARSATDAAAILGVIAGSDPNDPTTLNAPVPDYLNQIREGIRGLRIGVDHAFATKGVNEEVVAALCETEATFRELGADICEITVPALDHVSEAFLVLCSTEAAVAHKETHPKYASEYGNELAELIQKGRQTTDSQIVESLQERNRFVDALSETFQKIDLLLTPTLPFPVPRLDGIDFKRMTIAHENARNTPEDLYSATLRFTSLFNFGRNPAINFPADFSSGLPIGMQLAGRHLEEALLLRAAHAFQKSTGWHACHPADSRGAFQSSALSHK